MHAHPDYTTSAEAESPLRPSSPADGRALAVASTDAPASDAPATAQSGTPVFLVDIREKARVTLAAHRERERLAAERQRAAENAEREAERAANRLRISKLFHDVLDMDVPRDAITGYGLSEASDIGIGEVTLDGIRFSAQWVYAQPNQPLASFNPGGYHLFVLATCTRDGCVHQDYPVTHEVNGWGDLGAALEAIESGAVHTGGNCTSEDWD